MRRLIVAPRAGQAALSILKDSGDHFGVAAAERYRRLLSAAFRDIQESPTGSLSRKVVATAAGFGLYPIKYSLRRLASGDRVRRPRHLVAFWFDDDAVVILDILHDRMDLPARLSALIADRGLPRGP